MGQHIARILNNNRPELPVDGGPAVSSLVCAPPSPITLVTMGWKFDNIETALNLDLALELLEGGHGV
jgi:hypothetical protein